MVSRPEISAAPDSSFHEGSPASITRIGWHGWPDCLLIQNGHVEAVIVPSIARVMQLRLSGDSEGVFWENRTLDGQLHPKAAHHSLVDQWLNFGGDKCWPAPQASWTLQQGRYWPPPVAFDRQPMEAIEAEGGIVLTSSIDPAFGIQIVRKVELVPGQPVMRVRTEFDKLAGSPVKVGVWTITEMREPERIAILLPAESKFANGYVRLMGAEPADLMIKGGLLSLARHHREVVKIGTDGTSMIWVGRSCVVRIDAEQGPGEFPDGGCVTQVYTNPDPMNYVELETNGPLVTMNIGDRIERTTIYTITPRTTADPQSEAIKAL